MAEESDFSFSSDDNDDEISMKHHLLEARARLQEREQLCNSLMQENKLQKQECQDLEQTLASLLQVLKKNQGNFIKLADDWTSAVQMAQLTQFVSVGKIIVSPSRPVSEPKCQTTPEAGPSGLVTKRNRIGIRSLDFDMLQNERKLSVQTEDELVASATLQKSVRFDLSTITEENVGSSAASKVREVYVKLSRLSAGSFRNNSAEESQMTTFRNALPASTPLTCNKAAVMKELGLMPHADHSSPICSRSRRLTIGESPVPCFVNVRRKIYLVSESGNNSPTPSTSAQIGATNEVSSSQAEAKPGNAIIAAVTASGSGQSNKEDEVTPVQTVNRKKSKVKSKSREKRKTSNKVANINKRKVESSTPDSPDMSAKRRKETVNKENVNVNRRSPRLAKGQQSETVKSPKNTETARPSRRAKPMALKEKSLKTKMRK